MDWWWPGFLISFGVFTLIVLGVIWILTHWGTREVDRMTKGEQDEKEQ